MAAALAMGGYGEFVWSAFGLTVAVCVGVVVWRWRRRRRLLAMLRRGGGGA